MAAVSLLAVFLLVAGIEARTIPDLNDVFYSEIRDLLNQHNFLQEHRHDSEGPLRTHEVTGWPRSLPELGQVSGVSVNPRGQPIIFHRGPRVWDASSFNETHHFQHKDAGAIAEDTVLTLDPTTGAVVQGWGRDLFYLPHGITVDHRSNTWLTDVAMHQVFKFIPGATRPSLVFGEKFRPGSSVDLLCQPTAVAVATSGEVFIADGYCNSRILKFDSRGDLMRVLPQPPEFLSLQVPHSLALLEQQDLLCIADRDNMRVTCPRAGLFSGPERSSGPAITIQEPDLGRVYAVAAHGNFVYAVNGPTSPMIPIRGFTLDPRAEVIVDHWEPTSGFGKPHGIAICPNGSALYVSEIGPNKVWKFNLTAWKN